MFNIKTGYNINKVLLIGGFHKNGNHQKSIKYFINNGFECSTRINDNPDDDFLIMCYSKYFFTRCGGFSNVIKNIVNMKGGKNIEK